MTVRVLAVGNNNTDQTDHRSLIGALSTHKNSSRQMGGFFIANLVAGLTNVDAMTVGVGAFRCIVENSSGLGDYLVQNDSTVNITFDPGEASVVRTDRIIVRVYNSDQDGSGQYDAFVEYLKGQPSGQATTLPANSLLIWEFPVPAGASSGTGGINFTGIAVDKRLYTAANGGIIQADSADAFTAITNPYDGMPVYRRDQDILYFYDGTVFRPGSQVQVASESALSTVANPYDGLLATTRDTNSVYVHTGSAWRKLADGSVDTTVKTPTLVNGWVNYNGGYDVAHYYKDAGGTVHIGGLIANGTTTSGTTIFTLPTGYRPPATQAFLVVAPTGNIARIDVNPDGTVKTNVGVNAVFTSLSGISFRAA